jgi:mono/diheme cytochrome c family protein
MSFKNVKVGLFALVMASAALAGCSKTSTSNVYVPTSADTTATASLAELQQGRQLYIDNCAQCHSLYNPDAYTAAQWKSILPGMASRTSLTTAQVDLVTKYVTRGK